MPSLEDLVIENFWNSYDTLEYEIELCEGTLKTWEREFFGPGGWALGKRIKSRHRTRELYPGLSFGKSTDLKILVSLLTRITTASAKFFALAIGPPRLDRAEEFQGASWCGQETKSNSCSDIVETILKRASLLQDKIESVMQRWISEVPEEDPDDVYCPDCTAWSVAQGLGHGPSEI